MTPASVDGMSIPATCRSCGLTFATPHLFGGSGAVTLINCGTNCPRCGGEADIQSGTYQLVENVVTAFSRASVGRETVFRFGEVAKQVQAGTLSNEQATEQIASLGPAIAHLWKWTNDNGQGLALLLMIVALYLQITQGWSDDVAAEKQLKETQRQTQVTQSAEQVQQKILEELQKQTEAATKMAQQGPPQSKTQGQTPSTGGMTRQQRRARERAWKKRPPRAR